MSTYFISYLPIPVSRYKLKIPSRYLIPNNQSTTTTPWWCNLIT